MPLAVPKLLKDFAERALVAVAVFALFFSAFFLWAVSVAACCLALVAAGLRVMSATHGTRRVSSSRLAAHERIEPSLGNA